MKAILIVDMPENCDDCPIHYRHTDCPFIYEFPLEGRHKDCPLKPLTKDIEKALRKKELL